ncbi:hypothetical protein AGDE_15616 [Angomonas deanei]|uniref:First C2 domain of RPGR-interacting protein 1, putative n=1 Tax=Angomonas deanei TaxID=59799 RepID=A0A7G2CRG0_9TRYP|nr:hypothetical protein AGDE_15616 [Angomonas deanei]CAD2220762.1 First C2 domain of RPGR-interacting protein 1, putative [Angomonas deanei]|eukprot:EPY18758.1 hypothetical protein AGDE_15616 [Angomonas deanei]
MDPPALLDFSGAAAGDTEEEGDGYAEVLLDLPYDPATKGERVRELHEANAGLMAELAQMRLSNELLQTRIESLTGRRNEELVELEQRTKSLEKREAASQRLLDNHLDRVQFLESQVQSLRGYSVEKGASLDTLAVNENVFELFLGQLVAQEVPAEVPVPEMFSAIFFTADFLLHETVTSPTVNGLNGFFDTTISFQIAMDALLLYYLQTRNLLVQLHRVRGEGEVVERLQAEEEEGSVSGSDHASLRVAQTMYETIAEGQVNLLDVVTDETIRHAPRPSLRGHIKFFTPAGRHIASLEFRLTARAPFSAEFCQLAENLLPDSVPPPLPAPKQKPIPARSVKDWITDSSSSVSDRRPPKRSGLRLVPTEQKRRPTPPAHRGLLPVLGLLL